MMSRKIVSNGFVCFLSQSNFMTKLYSLVSWRARLLTSSLPMLSILAAGWCVLLLIGRIALTRDFQYTFLVWNLFLAAVPLLWSALLTKEQRIWKFWGFAALWLLFFPNAPYVLTDLVHLHKKARPEVPVWYDIGLLVNFGVVSLLFGIFSMRQVHKALEKKVPIRLAAAIISACALLAGFGVYLGRFLRWNSWDIVTRPLTLLGDVADRFLNPFDHPQTWTFTAVFGGTLMLLYWICLLGVRAERNTDSSL